MKQANVMQEKGYLKSISPKISALNLCRSSHVSKRLTIQKTRRGNGEVSNLQPPVKLREHSAYAGTATQKTKATDNNINYSLPHTSVITDNFAEQLFWLPRLNCLHTK